MGMTIAEKIFARASAAPEVAAGQYVDARIDRIIAHEEFYRIHTAAVESGFEHGLPRIFDPDRFHVVLEHFQPAINPTQAVRAQRMREIAARYGLKHFRDTLAGVLHRIVIEDYVVPGELALGSDSHSCAWGALNCAGTGMGEHELVYAAVTGELWFRVPETVKVTLDHELRHGVTAKDVALWLGGRFGTAFALYRSIEFTGPGAAAMPLEGRMTLAAHAVELGGKFGLFDYDAKVESFLERRPNFERTREAMRPVAADADARYAQHVTIDLAALEPQVARPHTFENVVPVEEVRGIKVMQAQIGSCANGHLADIELLAGLVKGRKVHAGTRLLVQPASWGVYRAAMAQGYFETILEAGGQVISPGCHLCLGMQGTLAPGDVCISSTTRNHRGRMGSAEAEIYLASPATVAAAAIAGEIVDPRELLA